MKALGEILLDEGLVTEGQLMAALDEQVARGQSLGRTLVEIGVLSEGQLVAALARQVGMEFIDLDDVALTQAFKIWARTSDDPALAKLCRGLLFRGLYKSVDLTHFDGDAPQLFVRIAQAVLDAGGDPEYDLFYDDPTDTPYALANVEKGIKVLQPDGSLRDVAEVSPMTEAMNKQLGFKRVHFAEQYRDVVKAAIAAKN